MGEKITNFEKMQAVMLVVLATIGLVSIFYFFIPKIFDAINWFSGIENRVTQLENEKSLLNNSSSKPLEQCSEKNPSPCFLISQPI